MNAGANEGTIGRVVAGLCVPIDALTEICIRYGVESLSIFGSVARGDFGPGSDIDVLVEFQSGSAPGMMGIVQMQDELSELFGGRSVHVSTRAMLDNPYRRSSVLRDLVRLYEAVK